MLAVDEDIANNLEEGNARYRDMIARGAIDIEKENFGKVFRSKVGHVHYPAAS